MSYALDVCQNKRGAGARVVCVSIVCRGSCIDPYMRCYSFKMGQGDAIEILASFVVFFLAKNASILMPLAVFQLYLAFKNTLPSFKRNGFVLFCS